MISISYNFKKGCDTITTKRGNKIVNIDIPYYRAVYYIEKIHNPNSLGLLSFNMIYPDYYYFECYQDDGSVMRMIIREADWEDNIIILSKNEVDTYNRYITKRNRYIAKRNNEQPTYITISDLFFNCAINVLKYFL